MVAPHYRNKGRKLNPYALKLRPKVSIMKRKSKKAKKITSKVVKTIVKKELAQEIETKIKALSTYVDQSPQNQDVANNVVYYDNYCLGEPASTWLGPTGSQNFKALEGFEWSLGTQSSQRVGRYMDLKHTTMNFRVGLVGTPRTATPVRFRVIVYRAKRNAPFGQNGGNPNDTLFLGLGGQPQGVNTSYAQNRVSFEFMNLITNKRNFEIHHDSQFILAPPVTAVQGGSNLVTPMSQGMYPNEKNFLWKLKHNEKTAFGANNKPEDANYQYCVSIFSMPTGDLGNTGLNSWRTAARGIVSVTDA